MLWLLLVLLLPAWTWADVQCNGLDDSASTSVAFSTFAPGNYTLLLVYRPTGTSTSAWDGCVGGQGLFGPASGASGDTSLNRHNNLSSSLGDRLCGFVWDGSNDVPVSTTYTNDTWVHLVLTWNGTTLTLYKDGALVQSAGVGGPATRADTLRLCGGLYSPSHWGLGTMAEAQVFPSALSATEVAAIGASRLRRVAPSAPSGAWDLACPAGTSGHGVVFPDRSGNGRTLTGNSGSGALTCAGSTFLTFPWGVMD